MAVGYLQNKNNNTVIELYNMFSRYRWQTYIFDRSQTIFEFTAAAAASMSPAVAAASMSPAAAAASMSTASAAAAASMSTPAAAAPMATAAARANFFFGRGLDT